MPENMGKDLALSEPFMQFGQTLASIGQAVDAGDVPQKVLDAFEFVKSHLSSGGTDLQNAYRTMTDHLSKIGVTPFATEQQAMKMTQVGPYQVQHVGAAKSNATDAKPAAKPASDPSSWPVVSKDDPSTWPVVGSAETAAPDQPKAPGSGLGTMAGAFETAKDLGKGFAKKAGRTVQMVADDLPHAFGGAGLSDYIDMATGRPQGTSYGMVSQGVQPSNTTQRVGGGIETAAEMAIPVGAAAEAMPSTARAGAKFGEVMGAAKTVPVDVSKVGNTALRIADLAQRGGGTQWGPPPVRQLIQYLTNPDNPALTYEVGRDFASNIGRLSVKDWQAMNPQIGAKVAELAAGLNESLAQAASKVGKGQAYAEAMNEYARAKRLQGVFTSVLEGAKRSAPYMTAAGIGGYLGTKIQEALGK